MPRNNKPGRKNPNLRSKVPMLQRGGGAGKTASLGSWEKSMLAFVERMNKRYRGPLGAYPAVGTVG